MNKYLIGRKAYLGLCKHYRRQENFGLDQKTTAFYLLLNNDFFLGLLEKLRPTGSCHDFLSIMCPYMSASMHVCVSFLAPLAIGQ